MTKNTADQGVAEIYNNNPARDPTSLTTQQLWREIASLKELMFSRLLAIETSIEVAHEDMVRVPTDVQKQVGGLKELHEIRLAALAADRQDLDVSMTRQLKTVNERVHEIEVAIVKHTTFDYETAATANQATHSLTNFKELVAQTTIEQKTAIAAALQAAKEAVGEQNKSAAQAITKSETATTKQIEQLGTLLTTTSKANDDKIDDIKQRLTRIEGRGEGKVETKSDAQFGFSNAFLWLGALIGFAGLLFGLLKH